MLVAAPYTASLVTRQILVEIEVLIGYACLPKEVRPLLHEDFPIISQGLFKTSQELLTIISVLLIKRILNPHTVEAESTHFAYNIKFSALLFWQEAGICRHNHFLLDKVFEELNV